MPDHTRKNYMIKLQLQGLSENLQKFTTMTRVFPEILAICYSRVLWASPCMPDHAQQKLHDQIVASIDARNKRYTLNNF